MRIIATLILAALTAAAQLEYRWDVEVSRPPVPARITMYRGETLRLAPRYLSYGAAFTPATQTLCWQTNGMATIWWQTNSLAFTPAMDVGAPAYTVFIAASTATGLVYRANAIVTVLQSPGQTPNVLPLPPQTIDFATVSVTNAPWLLPDALVNYYTQAEITQLIAPLALTQAVHQAISTAIVPLVSTQHMQQAISTAIAPLASTQAVSAAIAQSMSTQSLVRLIDPTNHNVRYEQSSGYLTTYTSVSSTGRVVGVSVEDDSYVISPSFYPIRIPWTGIAGPYEIETFRDIYGDGFIRINQGDTSWIQRCSEDITNSLTSFTLETGDPDLTVPLIFPTVEWSTNITTKVFSTDEDLSAHNGSASAHPAIQTKLYNLPTQTQLSLTNQFSTNANSRIIISASNGVLRVQEVTP